MGKPPNARRFCPDRPTLTGRKRIRKRLPETVTHSLSKKRPPRQHPIAVSRTPSMPIDILVDDFIPGVVLRHITPGEVDLPPAFLYADAASPARTAVAVRVGLSYRNAEPLWAFVAERHLCPNRWCQHGGPVQNPLPVVAAHCLHCHSTLDSHY